MADHGCFRDDSWNRDIIVCSYQLPCCLRLPLAKNTIKSPPHRPCLAQGILQLISNHATSDPWKGVHIPASLVKWWNICGPTCPCCLLLRFKLLTSCWQNQKATQCHTALKSGRMDLQAWNFTPSTWGWLCWHRRTSLNGSSPCNVTSKTVWDNGVQWCFASGFQQCPWRVAFVASIFRKKSYILVSIWIQNGNC